MGKLTARGALTVNAPGMHNDGGGLYLRIGPTGSKSWILRTRVHGKKRDVGLGGYDWVSLADARRKAGELRKVAREGGDPLAHRGRKVPTFAEAARQVYAEQIEPTARNAKHKVQWISTLEKSAFPLIGDRPVDQIEQSEILKVLQPMWLATPETARRVRQRLRTVFAWARTAGHREASNPVEDIEKGLPRQKAKVVHFAALPWREVPAFVNDLLAVEAISARSLRFAILTCARSGEVRGARWSEIDMDAAVWTIPADRMKAGAAHRVPLSAEALAILEKVRGLDRDLVFPGAKAGRPMSDMTLTALLRRMKRRDITVHGFRSTFRDWASERTSFPREVAEHCLAHSVGGAVERAYARSDLFEKRRELLETWASFATETDAAVVRIRA